MSTIDVASPYGMTLGNQRHKAVRETQFSMRGRVIVGSIMAILLVAGVGGWSATAKLSGAIIATGTVLVDEHVKVLQHLDGGIVRGIDVREGQHVAQGQVLLRLDDVQIRTEQSILLSELAELAAREARLIAERDAAAEVVFPPDYLQLYPGSEAILEGEQHLFSSTYRNRQSKREQFQLQIEQLREEMIGLEAQHTSLTAERELIADELGRISALAEKGLIEAAKVTAADRELVRITGTLGELVANIARSGARISEINVQIISVDDLAYTEAQRELRTVTARIKELTDRLAEVQNRLDRTEIRSPVDGTVNELSVTTLGGVITPAERLMTIVPTDADLKIEFRIAINDIDQIQVGQEAKLRFSAFNQRTTPEVPGTVTRISAAATSDPQSGQSYYLGEAVAAGEPEELGTIDLMPGMPVEVFVQTEAQVAIAYFAKPFTDQIVRAFREE